MNNRFFLILLLISLFQNSGLCQKKVLDHTVYNDWKHIANEILSPKGNYAAFEVDPHRGDGYLVLHNLNTNSSDSFPRAVNPRFSYNEKFVSFLIRPGFDTLRTCELQKIDRKKWPKDTLGIYFFERDTLIKIPEVLNYSISEEADLLVYMTEKNREKPQVPEVQWWNLWRKLFPKELPEQPASSGHHLFIMNQNGDYLKDFYDVTTFTISPTGKRIAMITQQEQKKRDSVWIQTYNSDSSLYSLNQYASDIKSLSFSHDEDRLAFLMSTDTTKNKIYNLAWVDFPKYALKIIADTNMSEISEMKSVSEFRKPVFSPSDEILFFGVGPRPEAEEKDTLLESEKFKVDVWNWQDDRLQPQQLLELAHDQRTNDLFAYHIADDRFVQLSNDSIDVRFDPDESPDYLLGINKKPYEDTYNWTFPNLTDQYRVNVKTGETELIMKEVGFGGELSPTGKYYTFFNRDDLNQYFLDFEKKDTVCITCSEPTIVWLSDNNGMPFEPSPIGVIGWTKNEKSVLLQSENDIWEFDAVGHTLRPVTGGVGLQKKVKMRLSKLFRDSVYYDLSECLVIGMDRKTKDRIVYDVNANGIKELYRTPHEIYELQSTRNQSKYLVRLMSLKDYPDVYIADSDFTQVNRISMANPQQADYNWATVELVRWKSYDSLELEGLLYKPEDFDTSKQYPLLVYYYELYSDELHNHYSPRPTASIIFPTEYASAGYVVFIPDVRYKEGHPAQSAYNCIMSGTDHVLDLLPNIDSTRMGLQGQSWGGYQTAQLITMTTRYKAAMAGAPVSNMFSAYGGIRWGSGLNRQFQYEKTQSRIGKTIWEAPELYVENSPLFGLPKVETPLLIMHNDGDGAVPWYQGIELFTAMKRLGKPCWLLNYNGDDHNLMKNANRMDLSIRMRQFFDYYLLGEEAPLWMTEGIPALQKGKITGY